MDIILDVDTQVDFMMRHGSLYVPNSYDIIKNIRNIMTSHYLPIISTIDEHDKNDVEFNIYPSHCVKYTMGVDKIPETLVYKSPEYMLKTAIADSLPDDMIAHYKQFIIPKKTYNIWDAKLGNPVVMKQILDFHRPETVFVVGVATEICVLAAVQGLAHLVKNIVVYQDAIKGLSAEGERTAIDVMKALGNVVFK